jgi:uncharacterized protein YoxC
MKFLVLSIVLFQSLLISNAHPVQKVITLLQELKAKVASEGKAEETTYGKFTEWCKSSESSLTASVESSSTFISQTENAVYGKEREVQEVQKTIERLQGDMSKTDATIKALIDERKLAQDVFLKSVAELNSTISSLNDAVKALKDSSTDALNTSKREVSNGTQPKVAGLLQNEVLLEAMTDEQEAMIEEAIAFEQDELIADAIQKPDKQEKDLLKRKQGYAFKSDGVVKLLEGMLSDFQDKLSAAYKNEATAKTKFNATTSELQASKQAAADSQTARKAVLAQLNVEITDLKNRLTTAKANKDADSKSLKQTRFDCKQKANEWNARKDARYGEDQAIGSAISILGRVSGVQTAAPKVAKNAALLSMSMDQENSLPDTDPRALIVRLLRQEARRDLVDSGHLELLASRVESDFDHADPKVGKDLITTLDRQVMTLKEEQLADDKKKIWCDLELQKTNASRDSLRGDVSGLNVSLLTKQAKVEQLQGDIDAAQKKIAELTKIMDEATAIRNTNKAQNLAAIEDASDAIAAVTDAIGVLTQFYSSASANAALTAPKSALLQEEDSSDSAPPPATWSTSYAGASDPKQGVTSVLQQVMTDFSKMKVDTEAQEDVDQRAYDKLILDSKAEKSRLVTETELKTEEKTRSQAEVVDFRKSMGLKDRELAAVKNYFTDLRRTTCVDFKNATVVQLRKAGRTQEIEQLHKMQSVIKQSFNVALVQTGDSRRFLAPIKPAFS